MSEYRPCIAIKHIEKKIPSQNINRLIDIKQEIVEHKALFHRWSEKSWVAEPVFRRQAGRQVSFLIGIVEYEDGTIHEHLSQEIQFTDGMAEKISKK